MPQAKVWVNLTTPEPGHFSYTKQVPCDAGDYIVRGLLPGQHKVWVIMGSGLPVREETVEIAPGENRHDITVSDPAVANALDVISRSNEPGVFER